MAVTILFPVEWFQDRTFITLTSFYIIICLHSLPQIDGQKWLRVSEACRSQRGQASSNLLTESQRTVSGVTRERSTVATTTNFNKRDQ